MFVPVMPQKTAPPWFLTRRNRLSRNIITHEMPIVAQYAERTVVFGRGHILLDGPRRDVFSQPDILKQTYVEPPQITRLDQVLRAEGLPPDILTVEEMQQFFEQTMPV
jgi:ABC-type glutathione transport system ATPase component